MGLLVLALVSRAPFRSQFLYHWGSVNFALSLKHYDVRLYPPHPPGYSTNAPGHRLQGLPSIFFCGPIHLRQVDAAQWLSTRLKFLSPLYGLTTAVLVANILFFLFAPAQLLGSNRLTLQTPGWQSIHQRDEYLGERLTAIRAHFDPQTTVVFGGAYHYRHVDYYLRDYQLTSLSYDLNEESELLPANVHTVVFLEPVYPAEILNRLPHESIALPDGQELGYVYWGDDYRVYLNLDSFELVKP